MTALTLFSCRDRNAPSHEGALYSCELFAIYPNRVAMADSSVYLIDEARAVADTALSYFSEQPIADDLFKTSIAAVDAHLHNRRGGVESVSTSELAFAACLGAVFVDADNLKLALKARVGRDGRIAQSTISSRLPWPVADDRLAWILAAWEVYKITGDKAWLAESYGVAQRTLTDDLSIVWDPTRSLVKGAGCSPDVRVGDTYPDWTTYADIFDSYNLSSNAMMYKVLVAYSQMARILGRDTSDTSTEMARRLAAAVNERLWQPALQHYSGALLGVVTPMQSPLTDNFGQALALQSGIPTPSMSQSIIAHTATTPYGVAPLWPLPRKKSDKLFGPYTQAYWMWGVAKNRAFATLDASLATMLMQSVRARARRSDATIDFPMAVANIAAISRVVAGIELDDEQLRFSPVVPKWLAGVKHLRRLRYRSAELDVKIYGTGDIIARFDIDGVSELTNSVSPHLKGRHSIEITMANNDPGSNMAEYADVTTLTPTPNVTWRGFRGEITNYAIIDNVDLFVNNSYHNSVSQPVVELDDVDSFSVACVAAVDNHHLTGFMSKPQLLFPEGSMKVYKVAEMTRQTPSKLIAPRDSSRRYIEFTPTRNRVFSFEIDIARELAGDYFMDLRYAKGPDLWGGQLKCTMRTLTVNGAATGVFVLPQTSNRDWNHPSLSNIVTLKLKPGRNSISLNFLPPYNTTKGRDPNTFLLREIRLIKKGRPL